MKTLLRLLVIITIIGTVSCTDKKKEEAEAAAMVEEVNAVELEVEALEEQIEKDTKALEETLKELDEI